MIRGLNMVNLKKKIFVLLTLSVFILSSVYFLNNNLKIIPNNDDISSYSEKKIKVSATDPVIHILNNWSAAVGSGIANGGGNYSDPYVIKDKIIDANLGEYGIKIEDSQNFYFIIENCTVYNAGSAGSNAGIKIDTSNNGTIYNNNLSFSVTTGVYMTTSYNNTIKDNYIEGTSQSNTNGIRIVWSENITVKNNLILEYWTGLSFSGSHNNSILSNTIYQSGQIGIELYDVSDSLFSKNLFKDQARGIELRNAVDNIFYDNIFQDLSYVALYFYDLGSEDSYNNTFYQNSLINNLNQILGRSNYNNASSQYWNYTNIGNYWDNYTGSDLDDDGKGDSPHPIYANYLVYDYFPIYNDGIDLQNGVIEIDALATGVGANNWTWAAERFWSSGSGSYSDPYIIQPYVIWDLTINGNSVNSCISISNSTEYFRIENTTLVNSGNLHAGLYLYNTSNAWIQYNDVSNNAGNGLALYISNNNTIGDNLVKNNSLVGIYLESSNNSLITGNILSNQTTTIQEVNSQNNILPMNQIEGEYTPLFIDDIAPYIAGSINWSMAIQFHWSSGRGTEEDPYIIENKIINGTSSGSVIRIVGSNKSVILNNLTVKNSGSASSNGGIYLENADNVTISNTNSSYHPYAGILLQGSHYNDIIGNILTFNNYGIRFETSDYNIISQNNISQNTDTGVFFGNIFIGPKDNVVTNNSFIGNALHAQDVDGTSFWNSSTIGNYWDDYVGNDADDNGIGDTQYNLAGGIDYLPIYSDQFNGSKIYIDDTGVSSQDWSWAETRSWLTGSGTSNDPYLIKDLVIDGGYSGSNIIIANSTAFFRIENCTLFNIQDSAIRMINSENGFIFDNRITNSTNDGIYLEKSNNTIIYNNQISNTSGSGVYIFDDSNFNNISRNIVNESSGHGINLWGYNDNNTIMDNLLHSNSGASRYDIHIYRSTNNSIVRNVIYNNSGSNYRSIGIRVTSNYNTVRDNQIYNNSGSGISAIFLSGGLYNTIDNNTIIQNDGPLLTMGMVYLGVDYVTCTNNIIFKNNGTGIYIINQANDLIIKGNDISNNTKSGIFSFIVGGLYYDNSFLNNNITNNGEYGMLLWGSQDNIISDNLIENNGILGDYEGISVFTNTDNNNFTNNRILDNQYIGFRSGGAAEDNLIFNNTFSGNGINAQDNSSLINFWNNSVNGNFWDDYGGYDINGDGIGETPYNITGSAGVLDNQPQTSPTLILIQIDINSPQPNEVFGIEAPTFTIGTNNQ